MRRVKLEFDAISACTPCCPHHLDINGIEMCTRHSDMPRMITIDYDDGAPDFPGFCELEEIEEEKVKEDKG